MTMVRLSTMIPKSIFRNPPLPPPVPDTSQSTPAAGRQTCRTTPVGLPSRSTKNIFAAIAKQRNIAPVGTQSPWRGSRRPANTCTTKAARGRRRMMNACWQRLISMESIPSARPPIHRHRVEVVEDVEDDRERDRRLGGGDDDQEDRHHLTVDDVLPHVLGEGHEVESGGVEDQLDS